MNRWEHWIEADRLVGQAGDLLRGGDLDAARVTAALASVHAVMATGQVPTDVAELTPSRASRGLGLAHPLPGGRNAL